MATPRTIRPGMLLDPGAPINAGLAGWWPMWEGAGGKTLDISGKDKHGTLTNGPKWAGGGLLLDGTDDYVSIPFANTDFGSSLSLSLEFTLTGAATTVGLFQVASGLSHGTPFLLLQKDTATSVRWYINGGYRITHTISNNTRYRITITFDGTTWLSYLNGAGPLSYTGGKGANVGTSTWIGNGFIGYAAGQYYNYRVWNRALSALEAQQLYIAPNIGLWVPDITRYYIPAAGGGFQPAWAANSNVLLGGGMAL